MKSPFTFIPATNSGSHRNLWLWWRCGKLVGECWRYLIASVLALGTDFGVYIAGVEWLHLHYLSASCFGFIAGLVIVYILSIKWVFSERNLNNKVQEFIFFVAIGLTGLFINQLVLFIATDLAHIDYRISKILSAGIVFLFNFTGRKTLLFSSRKLILASSKKFPLGTANV